METEPGNRPATWQGRSGRGEGPQWPAQSHDRLQRSRISGSQDPHPTAQSHPMSVIIDKPMRLNLHRRHSEHCTGGHPAFKRSYEADELRRKLKKCFCPIYASGTLGGTFRRKNTERTDWDEAKTVVAAWEQAGAWEPPVAPPQAALPVPAETADPERFTIERATKAYLDNREGRGIQPPTFRKYRTMVNQLRAFAETRGYVMLDQLGPTDMDAFYEAWSDGKRSKGKRSEER